VKRVDKRSSRSSLITKAHLLLVVTPYRGSSQWICIHQTLGHSMQVYIYLLQYIVTCICIYQWSDKDLDHDIKYSLKMLGFVKFFFYILNKMYVIYILTTFVYHFTNFKYMNCQALLCDRYSGTHAIIKRC
jgi:hypothetical protein